MAHPPRQVVARDEAPLVARNQRLVGLRRLVESRRARRQEGRFVIEGSRLLAEALDARVALDAVFCDVEEAARHAELLERARRHGIEPTWVAAGVLERVGDARTSQGVTALALAPPLDDRRAPVGRGQPAGALLVMVLVDVADPGNVGTLLRAADAADADAVVLGGGCADPLSPKVVRAAAGALFRRRVVELADASAGPAADMAGDLATLLTAWEVPAFGLVVANGTPLDDVDLTTPLALVVGGEARGIPAALEARLSRRVTIPMPGPAESLNVAMAGTVALFEALRQRRAVEPGASIARASTARPTDLARVEEVGQAPQP